MNYTVKKQNVHLSSLEQSGLKKQSHYFFNLAELRLTQQQEIKECCAHIFTETADCISIPTQHKTTVKSGEVNQSSQLSVYINDSWCLNVVKVDGQCTPFPKVEF